VKRQASLEPSGRRRLPETIGGSAIPSRRARAAKTVEIRFVRGPGDEARRAQSIDAEPPRPGRSGLFRIGR
jgi:hypothetical protein